MATKKREEQINKLYSLIKEKDLSKDLIGSINLQGFLYSVGGLNELQITAFLTFIAVNELGMDLKTCMDKLGE